MFRTPEEHHSYGKMFSINLCYVFFFFLFGISFLQSQKIISSTSDVRQMYIVFKAGNFAYFWMMELGSALSCLVFLILLCLICLHVISVEIWTLSPVFKEKQVTFDLLPYCNLKGQQISTLWATYLILCLLFWYVITNIFKVISQNAKIYL